MQAVTTIGLDIAKSVFQVHGIDAEGKVLIRRQLKRRCVLAFFEKLQPCLVGIEACATSHHWSRELKALGHKGVVKTLGCPVHDRDETTLRQESRKSDDGFGSEPIPPPIHTCLLLAQSRH